VPHRIPPDPQCDLIELLEKDKDEEKAKAGAGGSREELTDELL
jgi:hypothetical protein